MIHAATDNDIHPPRFGGSERSFGLARGMARGHDVRVLCVVPNRTAAPAEQTVDGVTLVRRKAWYTSLAWRLQQARLAPMAVCHPWHTAAARHLLGTFSGTPDVLCADLSLCGLLNASAAPLKVHTSHNVEYDHFITTGGRVLGAARWRERVRAAEERAIADADLTVVCSVEDAERMRVLYGTPRARLHVAPNGYDETRVRPPCGEERRLARRRLGLGADEDVALFIGSDVPHNRETLAFLIERLGPALAGGGPRLLIAGSITRALPGRRPSWLAAMTDTADLTPALHAADIGLNPATIGGGSNIKLPTYLAAGLAVIATPFGLRGFDDLAPWVVSAERDATVDALRARPRGWHARGRECPPAVRDLAWGAIGERLAAVLSERRGAGAPMVAGGRP